MKISINKKAFEKHLDLISKAIQGNSPLPSLQGVIIYATESNIQMTASNGNLSIKEIIEPSEEIKIIEPGKILVPGTLFNKIIKKQGTQIDITTTDTTMNIESSGAKTSLQLLNPSDYPVISFESIGKDLIVDGEALENIMKNVSFAAADNDKRIILNGVNLSSKDGFLVATATNSFRLAQEKIEIDSNTDFNITVLSKNLKDFIPKGVRGPLKINVNESKIITKHNSSTTVSKLIDGVYPNIAGLIPTSFKSILSIDSKKFSNLIDQATVVSDEGSKVIKLTINSNELLIESKKREIGNSIIKSNEHKWSGDELIIALNSQFLKDAINRFSGKVAIAFNGSHDPLVIKGEENSKLTQLILPHRTY